MNPLIQLKTTPPLLIALALLCFGLLPKAQAVSPPPDGGYPGANTAEGTDALLNLTSGTNNTAVGTKALRHNTTGGYNVGIGAGALLSNTSGNFNMAVGAQALNNNTANYNSAIGFRVLFMNTTGEHLTGIGAGALFDNTTGSGNTATGADALADNTTGDNNTAVGSRALFNLVGGHENTAVGGGAGANYIGTESNNICIGHQTSGVTGENNNIRIGDNLPSNGIVVGSKPSGETFVNIGTGLTNGGVDIVQTATAGTMRLGEGLLLAGSSTFIGGVVGNPQPAVGSVVDVTMQVGVGPNFQRLGIDTSSRRFKEDIKPMDKVSEAIFKLKPVTYRIKKETDSAQPIAFGLIAEDVAEACPALAAYWDGQPLGVHYKEVTVMLLNEFLKEHRKVQEQEATIAQVKSNGAKQEATIMELKSGMQALAATVKSQSVQIQKVSAQLEASKPAPQVVNNP